MTETEPEEGFWERNSRAAGLLIIALVVAGLCFDGFRVADARDRLTGEQWSRGLLYGALLGVLLVVATGIAWLAARGHPRARTVIVVAGVVAALLLYSESHPRRGPDDPIESQWRLAVLVGGDLLLAILIVAGAYLALRWAQQARHEE